jgi:ketosteroid isomerase-like protein
MSQENIEIVRRTIEAWNEHDLDSGVRFLAVDIEWMPASPAAVERAVYRGRDEVVRGFDAIWDTWDEFRFEEREIRESGDSVLWLGTVHMRASTSGIELTQEFANHLVVRDGKIVRAHAHMSWQEGLEAAGLSE